MAVAANTGPIPLSIVEGRAQSFCYGWLIAYRLGRMTSCVPRCAMSDQPYASSGLRVFY